MYNIHVLLSFRMVVRGEVANLVEGGAASFLFPERIVKRMDPLTQYIRAGRFEFLLTKLNFVQCLIIYSDFQVMFQRFYRMRSWFFPFLQFITSLTWNAS